MRNCEANNRNDPARVTMYYSEKDWLSNNIEQFNITTTADVGYSAGGPWKAGEERLINIESKVEAGLELEWSPCRDIENMRQTWQGQQPGENIDSAFHWRHHTA